MNIKKIVRELEKEYPGKKIVITDPKNPGEIVCEVEPGKEKSIAIAVVDFTRLHYHKKLTEVYKIIKGSLTMYIEGKKNRVYRGEIITIKPDTLHRAEGKETWLEVKSTPGWTPEDHILVLPDKENSRREFD